MGGFSVEAALPPETKFARFYKRNACFALAERTTASCKFARFYKRNGWFDILESPTPGLPVRFVS